VSKDIKVSKAQIKSKEKITKQSRKGEQKVLTNNLIYMLALFSVLDGSREHNENNFWHPYNSLSDMTF
jgi:hypothetical protein